MGLWASIYFIVYLVLVTFFYGAAALAVTAMFPDVMPLWA